MAIGDHQSDAVSQEDSELGTQLLHQHDDTLNDAVDYKGRPAVRSNSGYWRSAWFIIGVEAGERIAYYSVASNLITFLTGPLQQSTAAAAKNVNIWQGTASLLPLLGAFIADSYVGRYYTIIGASFVYILGLGMLTLSTMLPSCTTSNEFKHDTKLVSLSSPNMQVILFFFSLYLIAIGQGGHKPCLQAFGADQFDNHNPKESKARSSFFNWWYFTMSAGCLLTLSFLNYIQENLSWVLGFGIPCLIMLIGLVVFLFGTKTYRFQNEVGNKKSPFVRIGRVFAAALRNRRIVIEDEACGIITHQCSKQFKFLNKALFPPKGSKGDDTCSVSEVEETKVVLRLLPVWASSLIFGIVYAQVRTFFTKQGVNMDRTIFSGFVIPAASLQSLVTLAIVVFSFIYDRVFVPIARAITKKPSGITMLQRIGTGIFLSVITVAMAALAEMKRLELVMKFDLVDKPNAIVPMSVWWLIPQYLLFGVSEVFTMIGLQEFFYDQIPNELRSMGLALYLSVIGMGSFLSSFLISMIEEITREDGKANGWFDDNLNKAHIDYFYWLLFGLSVMGMVFFIINAKSYIYN